MLVKGQNGTIGASVCIVLVGKFLHLLIQFGELFLLRTPILPHSSFWLVWDECVPQISGYVLDQTEQEIRGS